MKVAVLYQESGEDATVEDRDVLVQRDAVTAALRRTGHQAYCLGCTLDLAAAKQQLLAARPDVVFNLVESLGGTDRMMAAATLLLDALQIPYTARTPTRFSALPTKWPRNNVCVRPACRHPPGFQGCIRKWPTLATRNQDRCATNNNARWILKPVWEHASFGVDDRAVLSPGDRRALQAMLAARERHVGRPLFAEQFIEGREFNLSLLNGQVLPAAEIDFSAFPADKPRIVGHRAKWDQDSFEYQQTPRRFDFPATDRSLLERLSELARECWQLFALDGYARIDFRVDRDGQPWILEVNANPCLSPDAGFAAALSRAGITYDAAIWQVADCAARRSSKPLGARHQALTETTTWEGYVTLAEPGSSSHVPHPRE